MTPILRFKNGRFTPSYFILKRAHEELTQIGVGAGDGRTLQSLINAGWLKLSYRGRRGVRWYGITKEGLAALEGASNA